MIKQLDYVTLTQELVRLPSPTGDYPGQTAVQDACLAALDAVVEKLEINRMPEGRPWTLATVQGQEPTVLFVCHTDTVPTGPASDWARDPHSGDIVDAAYIHGRGSVDMKGGLAAALAALHHAALHDLGAGVLMTSDEEIGGLGAEQFAAEFGDRLRPQLVVLPEATENTYSRGHRGASWFSVTAHGRAAHGSTPSAGVNAIRLLSDKVISALDTIPVEADEYLGLDSINLGTINGGAAPNMVPARASLTLDCRTVASGRDIRAWLESLPVAFTTEEILNRPPLEARAVPAAMDQFDDVGPVPYFTDGAMVQHVVGQAPLVVWGPGEKDQMHTVDERMLITSLDTAVANYCAVIDALGRNA